MKYQITATRHYLHNDSYEFVGYYAASGRFINSEQYRLLMDLKEAKKLLKIIKQKWTGLFLKIEKAN